MSYNADNAMRCGLSRIIMLLLLSVFTATTAYADRGAALAAQSRGDFTNAAKLWLPLANEGDPVAQYNLALLYQRGVGVIADNNLFHYWLSMAARHGLAEAYSQINKNSMQPTAQRVHVNLALSPQEWVAAQNPKYYTLQLASSTNLQLIEKYYRENELAGKAGYYRSRRSGEDWYALVFGAYPSIQDAKAAIENLPEDLKKWSPWVRNIKSIHKIMVH
jgi:TPR repeat protein